MKPAPTLASDMDGVVTARLCDCCGHHEIGVVDANGAYIPLRPGMRVRILAEPEPPAPARQND
jgi:hypothetical protein